MTVWKNSILPIKCGVALHYTTGWDNKGAMLISVIPSPHGTFPSTSWPVFQTETSCQTVPKKENSLYCSSTRSALDDAVPAVAAEGAARMAGRAPRPSHLFVWELDPSAALQCVR